ncbi:hypothetical protein AB4Y87_25395 [Paenarthrobacter sp. RAF54_2]
MQLPVDPYAADMSSQAAVAFGAGDAREGVEPVDGLKVRYRVAQGAAIRPCVCGVEVERRGDA